MSQPTEDLSTALRRAYPELDAVAAAASEPVYVVGGAVRDLLLGRGRADLDLVVVGDAAELAARLGAEPVEHERFGTAKVELEGHAIDIAGARTETYPYPGALPEVTPAPGIEADLGRRDFSVNAIAVPVAGETTLIDPHGGQADIEAGLLRILHAGSFVDDPTRAIRAARYAARLGFGLEPETERLLRGTDLGIVSAERREAELLRLAGEASAPRGFELLAQWGLLRLRPDGLDLVAAASRLLDQHPWREALAPLGRGRVLLAAAVGPPAGEEELAATVPICPSQAVEAARGRGRVELVLARALGAAWLDDYLREWSAVTLEIDGSDLIAAGVPEGEALGRGLRAALRAKLDGEIEGREQELAAALAAARGESTEREVS
jgi:tRNA nucleotidyltransferase (CCA-adding enzyme)